MIPMRTLAARVAALEGGRTGAARMLRVPLSIADDPGAVAGFIAEHRATAGWRGRVALIAVPDPCATLAEWSLRYSGTA